jgi:hypothetical protein
VRQSDIFSGLFLAALGVLTIFVIIPREITVSENYGLNPQIFPLTVMWLGTAVALLLVIVRLRQPKPADADPGPMQPKNWLFIVAISAFLAATYVAFETLGFLVAAPAALALLMLSMGEYRHPIRLVLVSACVPLAIYYSFDRLFVIQLP